MRIVKFNLSKRRNNIKSLSFKNRNVFWVSRMLTPYLEEYDRTAERWIEGRIIENN